MEQLFRKSMDNPILRGLYLQESNRVGILNQIFIQQTINRTSKSDSTKVTQLQNQEIALKKEVSSLNAKRTELEKNPQVQRLFRPTEDEIKLDSLIAENNRLIKEIERSREYMKQAAQQSIAINSEIESKLNTNQIKQNLEDAEKLKITVGYKLKALTDLRNYLSQASILLQQK